MYFYDKKRAEEFVRNNPWPKRGVTTFENLLDWHISNDECDRGCGECGKPAGLMHYEGYSFWNRHVKKHNPLCYSCHRRLYPKAEFGADDFKKFNCPELDPNSFFDLVPKVGWSIDSKVDKIK